LRRERLCATAAEALLLATVIFAVVAYGATTTWAIIVVAWATLALAVVTILRRPALPTPRLPGVSCNAAIALLAVGVAASTWFSIYPVGSIRDAARIFAYIGFFYVVLLNLCELRAVARCVAAMVIVAALLPFAGALQDWAARAAGSPAALISGGFRTGTFPNQDHFAGFLTLVLPAGLGLLGYLARERRWAMLGIIIPCLGLGTLAVMETLTRAAWLGILLGLLAMLVVLGLTRAISRERKLQAAVGLAAALLLAVGLAPETSVARMKTLLPLGDTPAAMAFRRAVWLDSLPIIRAHPLVGTGPRTFHLIYAQYKSTKAQLPTFFVDYPHNDYLQYAIEMGIPAAAALVAVLVLLICQLGRQVATAAEGSEFPMMLGALGSIVAFATAAFYSFELSITANGLLFWAMLAVGYRMCVLGKASAISD
jgi:O-antigen ligase